MKTQIFSRIIASLIIVFSSLYSFSKNIYVNDAKTSLDIYCTVAGSSSNDGLSPATPKATLSQAIGIAASGDVIYVDAGNYTDKKMIPNVDNLSIIGAGSGVTKFDPKVGLNTSLNFFMSVKVDNLTIKNISLSGYINNQSYNGEFITISDAQNILFENIISWRYF